MSKTTLVFVLFNLFASFNLFAHAGHDHNAASSWFVHLLWLAPVIVAAAIAIKLLRAKQAANNNQE